MDSVVIHPGLESRALWFSSTKGFPLWSKGQLFGFVSSSFCHCTGIWAREGTYKSLNSGLRYLG